LSLDNTFRVAKKATVVDNQKMHTNVMKGGVLSVINEKAEIVAWVCVVIPPLHEEPKKISVYVKPPLPTRYQRS
jgi:hypothetical protein